MEKDSRMMKSKKAQLGDMIFVIVTITSIAITFLVAGFIYFQIGDGLEETVDDGLGDNTSIIAYNQFGSAFPILDKALLFIIMGMIVGLIISSLYIPSSPVFIAINIVGFIILVFLGAVFANLYGEMLDAEGANNISINQIAENNFGTTTYIMSKLPWFGAIMVMISSIIMYAKRRSEFG